MVGGENLLYQGYLPLPLCYIEVTNTCCLELKDFETSSNLLYEGLLRAGLTYRWEPEFLQTSQAAGEQRFQCTRNDHCSQWNKLARCSYYDSHGNIPHNSAKSRAFNNWNWPLHTDHLALLITERFIGLISGGTAPFIILTSSCLKHCSQTLRNAQACIVTTLKWGRMLWTKDPKWCQKHRLVLVSGLPLCLHFMKFLPARVHVRALLTAFTNRQLQAPGHDSFLFCHWT